jgi:hypothetical protein
MVSPAIASERPLASVLKGLSLVPGLASLPLVGLTKKLLGSRDEAVTGEPVGVAASPPPAASSATPGVA